jgi:4-amino-4-deoxy-L-arabinose transferase-like glycosyltransferase
MPLWGVTAVAVLLGLIMFVWDLGSIGLVDETPPLFAASARGMAESGDWLIPQVNGLTRYDKPPLVYWLMAALYALPGHEGWDPWGSWSAGLPSALASLATLLLLCLLTAWWERRVMRQPQGLWLVAGLLYGLSPLVMLWSRIGVSDSLLTALVALAMVSSWWRVAGERIPWWLCWFALGLATLTKGPVALVLFGLCWAGFVLLEQNAALACQRLRPLRGLLVTLAVAAPWYLAAVWREGAPFVRSFFGYHNLQRFTEVVNRHQSPWWFYGALLVVASLARACRVLPRVGCWRCCCCSASRPPNCRAIGCQPHRLLLSWRYPCCLKRIRRCAGAFAWGRVFHSLLASQSRVRPCGSRVFMIQIWWVCRSYCRILC